MKEIVEEVLVRKCLSNGFEINKARWIKSGLYWLLVVGRRLMSAAILPTRSSRFGLPQKLTKPLIWQRFYQENSSSVEWLRTTVQLRIRELNQRPRLLS